MITDLQRWGEWIRQVPAAVWQVTMLLATSIQTMTPDQVARWNALLNRFTGAVQSLAAVSPVNFASDAIYLQTFKQLLALNIQTFGATWSDDDILQASAAAMQDFTPENYQQLENNKTFAKLFTDMTAAQNAGLRNPCC